MSVCLSVCLCNVYGELSPGCENDINGFKFCRNIECSCAQVDTEIKTNRYVRTAPFSAIKKMLFFCSLLINHSVFSGKFVFIYNRGSSVQRQYKVDLLLVGIPSNSSYICLSTRLSMCQLIAMINVLTTAKACVKFGENIESVCTQVHIDKRTRPCTVSESFCPIDLIPTNYKAYTI